jgi:hypothetical protein
LGPKLSSISTWQGWSGPECNYRINARAGGEIRSRGAWVSGPGRPRGEESPGPGPGGRTRAAREVGIGVRVLLQFATETQDRCWIFESQSIQESQPVLIRFQELAEDHLIAIFHLSCICEGAVDDGALQTGMLNLVEVFVEPLLEGEIRLLLFTIRVFVSDFSSLRDSWFVVVVDGLVW